jgi:hypothetical protein
MKKCNLNVSVLYKERMVSLLESSLHSTASFNRGIALRISVKQARELLDTGLFSFFLNMIFK